MKVIVAGTRSVRSMREVEQAIADALAAWAWPATAVEEIVTGGCRGVDSLAEQWGARRGLRVRAFPARWNVYGKGAGPKRNAAMAEYGDALVAVWDGKSPGTANIIGLAKARGIPCWVRTVQGNEGQRRHLAGKGETT